MTAQPIPQGGRIVVGYLRRSSVSKERPGDASREVQVKAIEAMAGPNVVFREDWGVSGSGSKTHKRVNYLQLRADIAAGKVSGVYAYSLSRLARSTKELADLSELCERMGTTLATYVDKIDTSSATGKLFFAILSALAQFESDLARERVNAAIEATRANGTYKNRVPFGFDYSEDTNGKVIVVSNGKADDVIAAYLKTGSGLRAAAMLNNDGVVTSSGKGVWSASTVLRIVDAHRPDLMPTVKPSGKKRPAAKSMWSQLVRCGICPRMMSVKGARNKALYCSSGRHTGHGKFHAKYADLLPFIQKEASRYLPNGTVTVDDRAEEERAALTARRERIGELYADGVISHEKYQSRLKAVDAELAKYAEGERLLTSITPMPQSIDWTSMTEEEIGKVLRRLWEYVALDPATGLPTHVVWRVDSRFYDSAERDAHTVEADRIAQEITLAA